MSQAWGTHDLSWPSSTAVLMIVTDGPQYKQVLPRSVASLMRDFGQGVLITANRPSAPLRETLSAAGVDLANLHIVDCVSSLNGLPPVPQPRVLQVESPTLVETIALRAEQVLRRLKGPRFLVLDSVSALALYNGGPMVAEFVHALVNRLRELHVPAALLLVERQAREDLQDSIRPLCDGVVRL